MIVRNDEYRVPLKKLPPIYETQGLLPAQWNSLMRDIASYYGAEVAYVFVSVFQFCVTLFMAYVIWDEWVLLMVISLGILSYGLFVLWGGCGSYICYLWKMHKCRTCVFLTGRLDKPRRTYIKKRRFGKVEELGVTCSAIELYDGTDMGDFVLPVKGLDDKNAGEAYAKDCIFGYDKKGKLHFIVFNDGMKNLIL